MTRRLPKLVASFQLPGSSLKSSKCPSLARNGVRGDRATSSTESRHISSKRTSGPNSFRVARWSGVGHKEHSSSDSRDARQLPRMGRLANLAFLDQLYLDGFGFTLCEKANRRLSDCWPKARLAGPNRSQISVALRKMGNGRNCRTR